MAASTGASAASGQTRVASGCCSPPAGPTGMTDLLRATLAAIAYARPDPGAG
ncbi:MAG: hypothetical protein ABR898_07845 [Terracidiphilus sp.]|jgi:hypothetical protein